MRPFTSTLPFTDAYDIVMAAAARIERIERVALRDADGRVAAADVRAIVDVPPFDRAAMDGYAVKAADTAGAPVQLRCVEAIGAGAVGAHAVRGGECVEIATGAPIPPGADAVVIVEDTKRHGDTITVRSAVSAGQHIGRRASDLAHGALVVTAGDHLSPSRLGALAATGLRDVEVLARPAVAILSTGDELVEAGRPLKAGQIYDVNRVTLEAVVNGHGGRAFPRPIAGDSVAALVKALDDVLDRDVLVFSGGSSVGERDLVRDALAARGQIHFHGIAVKPGKPTAFATVAGKPVFAMPGYPTSCLSNAYMLLVPFLRRMAALPPWEPKTIEMPLTRDVGSAPGRLQFYTVRITPAGAEPAFKASGDITSMAHADGYIEIPADVDRVTRGTTVLVKLF